MNYDFLLKKTLTHLTLVLLLLSATIQLSAADFYWISGSASNWNNSANWSSTSGGAGGAGIPGAADVAIFDANGLGNCNVDVAVNIGGLTINNYTSTIDLLGFSFTTSGTVTLNTGTINDGLATSAFTVSSTATTRFAGTTFGAVVNCSSGRIYLNGSRFNATASFTKTGAGSDYGNGGNYFAASTTFNNPSAAYLLTGGSSADTFAVDLTVNNTGTNYTYLAHNSANHYFGGIVTLNNTGSGANNYIFICEAANGTATFDDSLYINNTSTATNGLVRFHNSGQCTFNEDIVINNTTTTYGIYFGDGAAGSGSLAAGQRITVGGTGVSSGRVQFRNFTQNGGTQQNLTFVGATTLFYNIDSEWNGRLVVSSPRYLTVRTRYNSAAYLTHTGTTSDNSSGGNYFADSLEWTNSGTGYFMTGSAAADTFNSHVVATNNNTNYVYLAYNSPGNVFNGNLHLNNTGNGGVRISTAANATANVNGNITLTSNTGDGCRFGTSGGATTLAAGHTVTNGTFTAGYAEFRNFTQTGATAQSLTLTGTAILNNYDSDWGGDVTFSSARHYTRGTRYRGTATLSKTGATSDASVGGNYFAGATVINNSGSGYFLHGNTAPDTFATTLVGNNTGSHYLYFAHNSAGNYFGDVVRLTNNGTGANSFIYVGEGATATATFADSLYVSNISAAATNAYCRFGYNGTMKYNGHLVVESTKANGIYFGGTGGPDTLAAGQTVTVGPAGYTAGYLQFRDFTQVGATSQTLTLTGTAILENYDSDWGGNVNFSSARHYTRGTRYRGSATLAKTGATSDASAGGNRIDGVAIYSNSGSGYFLHGNQAPDSFMTSLTAANTGTHYMYFAHNSAGNYFGGPARFTNAGSGANSLFLVAEGAAATATFADSLYAFNNAPAATTAYFRFGNSGIVNYNGDIVVESNKTSGIYFGGALGSGTLAAGQRVTVGAGGFSAGYLQFRNFTQVGPTSQSLTLTGSALFNNYDADWGGDVSFSGPRLFTRGTRYRGTADLYKTGTSSDGSAGGNVFDGVTTINSSSTNGYILMGSTVADTFQTRLTVNNTGAHYIYMAYNSPNHYFGGSVTCNNSGSGTNNYILFCDAANATANFTDSVIVTNNSTATNGMVRMYNAGSATFRGHLVVSSTATGNGVRFGNSTGTGTWTAGNLITVGAGGFTDGYLVFQNFTEQGNTAQALTLTSNAYMYHYDSDWGGNVNFSAPRMYLRGTHFRGTSIISKTGAINDYGYGANIFDGVSTFNNSGSGYLLTGSTVADTFRTDLTANNTGTYRIYLAHNSPGNYFGGKVKFYNNATGTSDICYVAHGALATATFADSAIFENGSTGVNGFYITHSGTSTFNGPVVLKNHGTGTSNYIRVNEAAGNATFNDNIVVEQTTGVGIYFGTSGGTTTLANTRTISVGSGGYTTGYLYLRNFNQIGGTAQALTLTGAGYLYNYDSDWGGNVTFASPRIYTRGTHYRGTADLTKTGGLDDASYGSNTFDGVTTLTNTGSRYFLMGNNVADTFRTDVTANNNGTYRMYLAWNSPNNYFGGKLKFYNRATGTSDHCYIAGSASASATIADSAYFENLSTGVNTFHIAGSGQITFNGPLTLKNHGTGTTNYIYVNQSATGTSTFNDNIIVESSVGNGIYFGLSGGSSTLANGQTITVGPGGHSAGYLYMRNFTQTGGTAQNVTLTGTGYLYNYDSNWGGNVDFRAPRHNTRGTTYQGTTHLEKTGATNDACVGGNWFQDSLSFENSGTGYFMMGNGTADDHDGPVTFIKSSTGLLYPTYASSSTFADNIYFDLNTVVTLGASTGTVVMDGTTAQSINDINATPTPRFRRLTTNNPNDEITLNMPVDVQTLLTLTQGNINTTTTDLLVMYDNATVGAVSNAAYVRGPIEKIGNDQFDFPVGDSGVYMPIGISAPSNGSHRFRAEYVQQDPWPTYSGGNKDATLDHVSTCEYWLLDRTNGNSNVNVTLNWQDYAPGRSCSGVNNLPTLRVARWDGSLWRDHGNGGTTGNNTAGSVTSSAAVTAFSPFTLASSDVLNPLPIELLDFRAEKEGDQVNLYWTTASEINNDYFTIERSTDGRHFKEVARQDGAGNSNVILNYSDVDLGPEMGINYYRLKQVDFNGSFSYSDIIPVKFEKGGEIKIYPTLTKPGEMINIEGGEVRAYELIDPTGKLIARGKILRNTIAIPVFASNGMYILRLEDYSGVITTTRVVVNGM